MPCDCKCCCGCCCDGETGSQSLEPSCEAPKVFHGKGTSCDVCCDLGEIREDITSEEDCPGTWVVNGRCTGCTPCSGPCGFGNPCPEGCACVDGQCVPPPIDGGCCGWVCDFLGDILWPEDWYDEDSPNYENYLSIPPPEGWAYVGYWRKVVKGVENCSDDPDVIAAIQAELEAELNAYVVPLGGVVHRILLDPGSSGQGCFATTEQECPDYAGTWYESQEECLGNCPNPLP